MKPGAKKKLNKWVLENIEHVGDQIFSKSDGLMKLTLLLRGGVGLAGYGTLRQQVTMTNLCGVF